MKAIIYKKYGNSDVLQLDDVPKPKPKQNEVLIKIYCACINPVDWKIRRGDFKIITGKKFPKIPGQDCAGIVEQVGAKITKFKAGDEVIATTRLKQGCYAEYVCAKEKYVFKKWQGISFEEASCLPIAGVTALQALKDKSKIAEGMHVLINGASGGVGSFAIQIAKTFNCIVVGTCSKKNLDIVANLGADRVIDYTSIDFIKENNKYDIIFDAVSTRKFKDCKVSLSSNGVFINTLLTPEIAYYSLLTFFSARKKCKTILVKPQQKHFDWFEENFTRGKIKVLMDKIYKLEDAQEATEYSESGRAVGKICLKVI